MSAGFIINIKPVKSNKTNVSKSVRRISKKTIGKCYIENGEFIIRIPTFEVCADIEENSIPAQLVLPFTEESLNLKNKTKVFSKTKSEHGYVCYIRSKEKAMNFPGLNHQYSALCENWLCSGYVVRSGGKLMFELKEVISPENLNFVGVTVLENK